MKKKPTFSIFYKVLSTVLIVCLLLPIAVKASHSYNHKKHIICNEDGQLNTHFHEKDLHCDFYKFQISKVYYATTQNFEILKRPEISEDFLDYYISYKQLQQLTRFQRGPPKVS
ncbi:hypothetical protein Q2T40_11135 [Winogradskyella maritima]|uniref:Secreted protein n=1 Tax=Winogradskyella maritima TaxID=1517766 RepID=A0ABV8AHN0_9FLAO|nr:hypothetical protein [Winogradskyella maritima]